MASNCRSRTSGENGYSFIRNLRQLGPTRDAQVPVIALTALAGEEDRRRSFAAGFQEHLSKPVDIDRLVQTVSALSQRTRFGPPLESRDEPRSAAH